MSALVLEGSNLTLCGCGCGQPTNASGDEAKRLFEELGTQRAVGERLGVTRQRVAHLLKRQPPRFIHGHNGRLKNATKQCVACGREFVGWFALRYCPDRGCQVERDEKANEWLNDHALSLDRDVWRDNPGHGLVCPSPEDLLYEQERVELLRAILGDVEIEDVGRLNDDTLTHLRERLSAAGLVHFAIASDERERWQPKRRTHHRTLNRRESIEAVGGMDDELEAAQYGRRGKRSARRGLAGRNAA